MPSILDNPKKKFHRDNILTNKNPLLSKIWQKRISQTLSEMEAEGVFDKVIQQYMK